MAYDTLDNYDNGSAWYGSGLKYAVTMTCEGFSMDTDDWEITVTRGPRRIVFTRENSVRDDQGQWYICIDTKALGPGELYITFDAAVPDSDFEDGVRHEIQRFRLINSRNLV